MKPILAFHQGSSLISKAILWQTRGIYSHASIVLPDGSMIEAREGKGVQKFNKFTPGKGDRFIDFYEIIPDLPYQDEAIKWLHSQLGKPYDWSSVFRFVSRRQARREASGKWFCSELAYSFTKKAGADLFNGTEPWEVHPSLAPRSVVLRFIRRENA